MLPRTRSRGPPLPRLTRRPTATLCCPTSRSLTLSPKATEFAVPSWDVGLPLLCEPPPLLREPPTSTSTPRSVPVCGPLRKQAARPQPASSATGFPSRCLAVPRDPMAGQNGRRWSTSACSRTASTAPGELPSTPPLPTSGRPLRPSRPTTPGASCGHTRSALPGKPPRPCDSPRAAPQRTPGPPPPESGHPSSPLRSCADGTPLGRRTDGSALPPRPPPQARPRAAVAPRPPEQQQQQPPEQSSS